MPVPPAPALVPAPAPLLAELQMPVFGSQADPLPELPELVLLPAAAELPVLVLLPAPLLLEPPLGALLLLDPLLGALLLLDPLLGALLLLDPLLGAPLLLELLLGDGVLVVPVPLSPPLAPPLPGAPPVADVHIVAPCLSHAGGCGSLSARVFVPSLEKVGLLQLWMIAVVAVGTLAPGIFASCA